MKKCRGEKEVFLDTYGDYIEGAIFCPDLKIENPKEFISPAMRVKNPFYKLLWHLANEWFGGAYLYAKSSKFWFKKPRVKDEQKYETLEQLKAASKEKMSNCDEWTVLLTGVTGHLGMHFIKSVYEKKNIKKIYALIRPKSYYDKLTQQRSDVMSAKFRGEKLLEDLQIPKEFHHKFIFSEGDVEEENLGLSLKVIGELKSEVTHIIHLAENRNFYSDYKNYFSTNVLGTRNILNLAKSFQNDKSTKFVSLVHLGSTYGHGKYPGYIFKEQAANFPIAKFNNYYELSKAMAANDLLKAMLNENLRCVQLIPSIIVGDFSTGNNFGDSMVINAPVNFLSYVWETTKKWKESSLMKKIVQKYCISFPANSKASLNLVGIDRVIEGIINSLSTPECIGEFIHLAGHQQLPLKKTIQIYQQEVCSKAYLMNPFFYQIIVRPSLALVKIFSSKKLKNKINNLLMLIDTFQGYVWGKQPVYKVEKDLKVLKLEHRKDPENLFRILCRHHKYVLDFGKRRTLAQIVERERLWKVALELIESETGKKAYELSRLEFDLLIKKYYNPESPDIKDDELQKAS